MTGRKKRTRRTGNVEWEDLSGKNANENTVKDNTIKDVSEETEEIKESKDEYNQTDFEPNTEKSHKESKSPYNPLVEKDVKDVGQNKFATESGVRQESTAEPLPEQEFTPPPTTAEGDDQTIQDTQYEDINEGEGKDESKEKSKDGDSGGNLQDLPPSEKKQAAKMLADYLLQSYAIYVPKLYRMIGRVSDKKIKKLEDEGKINFNIIFQRRNGTTTTIRQTVNSINRQLDNSFDVTPEWIEDVRKPLERLLAKKEWGITDEGYVILKVVEHNANCIAVLISIKSEMTEYLEIAKEITMKQSTIIIEQREQAINKEEEKRDNEKKQSEAQTFTQPPIVEQNQQPLEEVTEAVVIPPQKPTDEGDLPPTK